MSIQLGMLTTFSVGTDQRAFSISIICVPFCTLPCLSPEHCAFVFFMNLTVASWATRPGYWECPQVSYQGGLTCHIFDKSVSTRRTLSGPASPVLSLGRPHGCFLLRLHFPYTPPGTRAPHFGSVS